MKRRWPYLHPDVEDVYVQNNSKPHEAHPKPVPLAPVPDLSDDDGMSARSATLLFAVITIVFVVAFIIGLMGERL